MPNGELKKLNEIKPSSHNNPGVCDADLSTENF